MKKNFYLTTTLPYVNGEPHIGHTLEFVQADVICRFRRQMGEKVYFNTGTDEHGLKQYQKAQEASKSVKEYVDFYAERFKEFCKLFNISYDRFIRTTDPDHYEAAKAFWKASEANGDIYKKKYEGIYCVGCEEFKTEKDLIDGKCPLHDKVPITHSEENYFFKFSKYQDRLLELYKTNPQFVRPESKLQEMISFVSAGLEDISISRKKENLPWGVPVPGDDSQVMYVWFDALVNYVTTIGYGSNEDMFKKWWPVVQLCGPDNNRFQSALWQAMLMSAGIEPSKVILVHGMVLAADGTKMSKTKGNVVSPFTLLEKYGYEPSRYYLISGIPSYSDSSFSFDQLEAKYKSDLQNNFGNLLNRVITMINKKEIKIDVDFKDVEFDKKLQNSLNKFNELMYDFQLYEAYEEVRKLAESGNIYITENAPWEKTRTIEEVNKTLQNLHKLLSKLIEMYTPLIPESAAKAKTALEKLENIILFKDIVEEK
jgi:methionyl-tRNA synthetase